MITILHAADLHLDSPFAGLTPELAQQRRQQQRQLPAMLVDLCIRHRCDLLLLAGDVFDGARVSPETVEALQEAFQRCPAQVLIAPGNHDPYEETSPWLQAQWPEHVHIFGGPVSCVELPELGCRVWGSGFTGAACEDSLPTVSHSDVLQIGVFHGDPLTPGPYRHIAPRVLETCGLDYLALGHIHKPCLPRKAGRTWYAWPGVAMGRGFDETGVHGVICARLADGRCEAEFLPLPGPRYERLTLQAGSPWQPPADSPELICRLTVKGEAEPAELARLRAELEPQFLALELRDETVPPTDLWATCGDGTLRGLALETLKAQYDAAEPEQRRCIALAARYVLAAVEGRDAPCEF